MKILCCLLLWLLVAAGWCSAQSSGGTSPVVIGTGSGDVEEFGGIGAVLNKDPDAQAVFVAAVLPGLAAARAGIQQNDIIAEVAGETVYGKELADVVALIRGPVGSPVEIVVMRDTTAPPLRFTLTRESVVAPR